MGIGDPLPVSGLSGDQPALVWAFAVEQCLGCTLGDRARMIRGLQRRLGGADIKTLALAVGEGPEDERDIVTGFLTSQRVNAEVEITSRRDYVRDFGASPLSVIYVTGWNRVIEAVVPADSVDVWRSADGTLDLAGLVEFLAGEKDAPTGTGLGRQ